MSIPVAETPSRSALVPGKKYRFHARSADEAVQIIHRRMGPKARVVAVEQVGGQGLGRLLRSPKLEVIAVIPPEPAIAPEPPKPAPKPRLPQVDPELDAPLLKGGRDLRSILRRLGFSAELLARFATTVDPRELGREGWSGKLDRFVRFLWDEYGALPSRPLTGQVAFLGAPGSGVTSALCKELTAAVFLREEQPLVARLETEQPGATEGLSAFCGLMQIPIVGEARAALTPNERIFWDVPGISSRDFDSWRQVGARLDDLAIGTRVLVAHAAFDSQHLLQLAQTVESVRPTHLVFSHFDEVVQPARLWDFLLSAGLSPLFVGENASVTAGRREDFHAALLAQTFPAHLNPSARTES